MCYLDKLLAYVITLVITSLFFDGLIKTVAGTEINAIFDNGKVRSFQISAGDTLVRSLTLLESPQTPPIPPYCRSSLVDSCLQAEANGTIFYAPVENSSIVIKLTIDKTENQTVRKEVIQLSCLPSDLVTMVYGSLIVACRDAAERDDFCEGSDCNNIVVNNLNDRVTPIVYSGIHGDRRTGQIIATILNPHRLVTYIVRGFQQRTYNLPTSCSEPLDLSRQKSSVILTCTNETQFWINITDKLDNAVFYPIESTNGPLLALSNHGFALFLAGSQLTLQNVVAGDAVTQTIPIDNTGHTVFADFTTDGKYAFVAINRTAVMFIYVTLAITDDGGQYFHTMTTSHPLCPTCPAVQFLSTTIAVVSSYNVQSLLTTTVSVLLLTQWPPCLLVTEILIGQPRQYWLNPSAPLPGSCGVGPSSVVSVLVSPSPTNNANSTRSSTGNGLSSGAVVGIAVGTLVGLVILVLAILFPVYRTYKHYTRPQQPLSNVVQQPPNNQHVVNPTFQATEERDNPTSRSQMIPPQNVVPPQNLVPPIPPPTTANSSIDDKTPQPNRYQRLQNAELSTAVADSSVDDDTHYPISATVSELDLPADDK